MLSLEQDRAAQILKTRIKNPISILQGAAGTGKSYLLSNFLESLNYNSDDIAFVTFTGTAAKILQKQNLPATTIHKLIYKPIIVGGICIGFTRLSKADVGHLKLIIVDEFSMVSQDILDDLMSYKIPLLLVGDQAQLPPIGTPNKYINSADAILTEVHRQALDNPILWAATQIRLGNGLPNGIYGNKLWVGNKKDMDPNWIRPDVQIITGLNATKDKYNLELAGTPRPMENHRIMF